MPDSLINTLALIFIILALFELVRNNVLSCLAWLGITGAIFIGMAIRNHDGKSLIFFLISILIYVIIFITHHTEHEKT